MVGIPFNFPASPPPILIAKTRSGSMVDRIISLPRNKNRYSFGSNSILSLTPIVGSNIPISRAKFVLAPVILSSKSPPFFLSAKTSKPYPISKPNTSCSIAFSMGDSLFSCPSSELRAEDCCGAPPGDACEVTDACPISSNSGSSDEATLE